MPQTVTATETITVVSPLVITTTSLPNAAEGVAYSQQLVASGGVAPYIWSLASGASLPEGLSLSPAGVISGIPTTLGAVSFGVQVVDSGS